VTLLLPFILATGQDLPLSYGVFLFGVVGYLALIALFPGLRRRFFSAAGPGKSGLCLLALSFATPISFLFRRHSLYEFPISAGFCFFMFSLLCLFRALDGRPRRWWLAAAGLFLGLAIGSRPPYVLCACIFLVPLAIRSRNGVVPYGFKDALGATIPLGLIVAVLLAYNYARFDNPMEFGVNYELSGIVEGKARHFSFSYFPLNLWVYFFAPLRWGRYFPFIHGIGPQWDLPGYGEIEGAFGAFTNLPFLLLSLIPACSVIWKRIRSGPFSDRDRAIAILASATFSVAAFLCCFYWAVARYMTDFTPGLALLATLGLLQWTEAWGSRWAKGIPLALGWGAFLAAACVATLLNFQSYGKFSQCAPEQYAAVARAMDAPLFWLQGRNSGEIGPLHLTLNLPPGGVTEREYLVQTGWPDRTDRLFLEQTGPGHVRFGYLHGDEGPPILSPSVPVPSRADQLLEVDLGSLYPPAGHPFYRGMPDGEISRLRNGVRVRWNGDWIWQEAAQFYEASPGTVRVGRNVQGPDEEQGFAGAVASRDWNRVPAGQDPASPSAGAK
jgi:hypothetical protein